MFHLKQKDDGSAVFEANGGGSETDGEFGAVFDTTDAGVEIGAALGRGASDTDRTYLRLKRSDGTSVYLYVDTGTTLVVSTTKP